MMRWSAHPQLRKMKAGLLVVSLLTPFLAGCAGGYGGSGNGGGGGGGSSAPTTPTGLTATPGNAQVSLTWNASSGATGYYVKRSTTSGGPYTQIQTQASTGYTDSAVSNGTKYFYVVSAYNSYGQSVNSAEVSATPTAPGGAPTAPSNVMATPGDTQVSLVWSASAGATSYHVKRSTTTGGPYTQISAPNVASYADTGLTDGTPYFYVVSALNSSGESPNSTEVSATPKVAAVDVTITVNPAITKPISPYIYGMNFYSGVSGAPPLLTFDRAGGNRWTAYNWINNASNAGSDYFYENDNYLCPSPACNASTPAEAVRLFISGDQSSGLASLVTLQMQGYVSVDTNVVQVPKPFPNLLYFRPVVDQKSIASSAPFTQTPPSASTDNNVYMDEFAWVLDQKFLAQDIFGASATRPTFISLDNEPDLWNSTHAEIQGATNVSTAGFITKTVNLATALKDLSKNAQSPSGHFSNLLIFGPVNYGFNGMYSWQGDSTLSPTPSGADWFADKYLSGVHAASTTYGAPLVDVYDFHWYAEVYDSSNTRITNMTGSSLTDAQVQLIVQSPRALWDTTWMDTGNSNPWIFNILGGPINILGRLEAKIAAENPGMKLAITEYNNGGSNHIAGTIAQADNLGIFGAEGLFAASLWPLSSSEPYTMAGFRAYRGFDGASGSFGDTSIQASSSNVGNVVVYASADSTTAGRIVFVAINRSTSVHVTAINGQALAGTAHLYQMTAASAQGQNPVAPISIGTMAVNGSSMTVTLPALSVTTIDIH